MLQRSIAHCIPPVQGFSKTQSSANVHFAIKCVRFGRPKSYRLMVDGQVGSYQFSGVARSSCVQYTCNEMPTSASSAFVAVFSYQ